ncbi:MAG: exodeoxyribonuclease III [Nanoarchaeota archaeon]|nr:exodeoxyribonuclease III [Nanoarchaeota archaeon]MBU1643744.1 exodeoxyribonuclease III [Nanoarchaeota archaeon]MBU1977099.1 exodeoxyribonuclease III [Nanoarchaeota archaeon]
MKIISWNVNGIRAIIKKKFLDFVKKENPDILCVQETKAHPDQVDEILKQFEHNFWNSAEKKGYSGTAIFSKIKPLSVHYGKDQENHKGEGRIIAVEFETFYLVTVYTPNSGEGLRRLSYRAEWDQNFLKYLQNLEKTKPVIVCGDLNVAHKEIDLSHPKANYNKTAGYTQTEIDGLQKYLDNGFVDSFREFNKEPKQYSYWSYRFNCRAKNIGWRIDYFLVSEKLKEKLKGAFILSEVNGSDHCPVGIELGLD